MTLLVRHLIKQNGILLFFLLLIATSIYIVFNFVDNMGRLTSQGASFVHIAYFYLLSIPYIVKLLFPLLFFLAIVIQMVLLKKSRELIALLSAGIAPRNVIQVFLWYALVCAIVAFCITEFSVYTENLARSYYRTYIRKQPEQALVIPTLWVKDSPYMVYSKFLHVKDRRFDTVRVYDIDADFRKIQSVYEADTATLEGTTLVLHDVRVISYTDKTFTKKPEYSIPFPISLSSIATIYTEQMYLLSFTQLWSTVRELSMRGIDAERLSVEMNTRITDALYTIILAMLALWIGFTFINPYAAVGFSVLVAVLFFLLKQLVGSLGNLHILNPIYASWYSIVVLSTLSVGVAIYRHRKASR